MKRLFVLSAALAACSAGAFEKIALVDHFDYANFFDAETREGVSKVLDHVMETGPDRVLWRAMSGAVPCYLSEEEALPSTVPPRDLRRLPLTSDGGWIHFETMTNDLFGIFRGLCVERNLAWGAHWTVEEAHWLDWSVGSWNLEHPQYWCRDVKGQPWPGKASLAFPEVREHKLRLADEMLARGAKTIFYDTCRYSGWTPGREYVKPNLETWRRRYGSEPPPEDWKDPRWTAICVESHHAFLRALRERCARKGATFMLGLEEAGRTDKGGELMLVERAIDWKRLVREGGADEIGVICVSMDPADPWGSTRRIFDDIVANKGRAKVYFPVRMYDFWKTSVGIPSYEKASGLTKLECAKKLLELADEAGGDGVILGCVDYGNYSPEIREAIRTFRSKREGR